MKKFIATSLAAVTLLSSVSMSGFAANIGKEINKCNYIVPKFSKPLPERDKEWTVFYSSQGKIKPDPLNKEQFLENSYDLIELDKPEMKRCWKTLNPKKFGRKVEKVDPSENSFTIQGPAYKAEWWNLKNKIKYWWKPEYVTLNYAIVITSKEDEKALEAKEVKEGQIKKEIKEERDKISKIKKDNETYLKEDWLYKFGDSYINNIKNVMEDPRIDPDVFGIAEKRKMNYLNDLTSIDKSDYYTKEEADKVNKTIRLKKAEVLKRLSEKSKEELITSGKLAELPKDKELTFRLIINNNLGDGDADKLAVLLSNNHLKDIKFNEVNLKLKSTYVCPLPERLQDAAEDAKTFVGTRDSEHKDLIKLIKEVDKSNDKLTFTQSMSKLVPELLKDLYNGSLDCCKNLNGRCKKFITDKKKSKDKELTIDSSDNQKVDPKFENDVKNQEFDSKSEDIAAPKSKVENKNDNEDEDVTILTITKSNKSENDSFLGM